MALAVSSTAYPRYRQCTKRSVILVGTVVAYNQLAALVMITDAPGQHELVLRADRALPGKEAGQYVKIVYKHWANEASLPEGLFDGRSKWRFSLKRDYTCD